MITRRGNRSRALTLKLSALAVTGLAGAGLLAGCGGSPAAAPQGPATRPAATAAAPGSLSAADLVKGSLAALRSAVSVHIDTFSVSQNGTVDISTDVMADSGRRVLTTPEGARATELLVDGVVFIKGNSLGLLRSFGFAESERQRYAGQWIAFQPGDELGDQFGDVSYDILVSQLNLGGVADSTKMVAPEKLTGAATRGGQRVLGVSGALPASEMPAGTTQDLYAADNASLRPVEVTVDATNLKAIQTFTRWGELVTVSAPPDSVAATTLIASA